MKFSLEQKQEIIAYSEQHGLSNAKRVYGVWPETIRYWAREDVRESHNSKSKEAYHTRYKYDKKFKFKKKEYYRRSRSKDYNLDYSYTEDQCLRELGNLSKNIGSYNSLPTRNRIIHTFQPHFFHVERELWQDKDIQKKLLANRQKYLNKTEFSDREILRGFKISGIHIGYSHFSPLWFRKFISDNNIKSVYDPCGGWGHRMIGAYLAGVDYIYNDLWDKTYKGCIDIKQFLQYDCKMYNEDATKFTPEEDYECVFTCPPYNNIEIYNNTPIEDYDLFVKNMINASVKSTVHTIGIVINNVYIDTIVRHIPNTFKHVNTYTLGTSSHISHFNKVNTVKSEVLLVFKSYV
jgi:hypothetical protein